MKGFWTMIRVAALGASAGLFLMTSGVWGQTVLGFDSLKFSGFGAMEMGQIVRGYYDDGNGNTTNYSSVKIRNRWQQRIVTNLGAEKSFSPKVTAKFSAEAGYNYVSTFPAPNGDSYDGPVTNRPFFIVDQFSLDYKLFDQGDITLNLRFGYFPFKYNAAATNFGEYLFRTTCYPNYIVNTFDYAKSRILGLRIENTLWGFVHQDLLVTSETVFYPNTDISLTYMASANFFDNALDIGVGISGYHLIPVDGEFTTPRSTKFYLDEKGDTAYYSFKGTKLMARATFDPKPYLRLSNLGNQDLLVYSECTVLGLKNYPKDTNDLSVRYDILSERVPVMAGINLPTHQFASYCVVPAVLGYLLEPDTRQHQVLLGKHISGKTQSLAAWGTAGLALGVCSWLVDTWLGTNSRLDLLSLEGEYHSSRYYNNNIRELKDQEPFPIIIGGEETDTTMAHRVKWSLSGSKAIGKNMRVVLQAARDHRRLVNGTDNPRILYGGDITYFPNDWYFMGKFQFNF